MVADYKCYYQPYIIDRRWVYEEIGGVVMVQAVSQCRAVGPIFLALEFVNF